MFAKFYLHRAPVLVLAAILAGSAGAQAPTPAQESNSVVLERLNALRDSFVNQIKLEGFQPSLAPPTIILDNPPSFGDYENDKNLLHIAAWVNLAPEDQARFERLGARLGQGQSGEALFEESVHHWVFVHELGHWWQACEHKTTDSHYAEEYGANRIAAAYWLLRDPAFMDRTARRMAVLLSTIPSPVPSGQKKEVYFNENYEKLGPTAAYRWFQESMVIEIQEERPQPSFRETLQHPTHL
jgi:hypothetical protein